MKLVFVFLSILILSGCDCYEGESLWSKSCRYERTDNESS